MRKIPKEISQLLLRVCPLESLFPIPDRSEKVSLANYTIYFKMQRNLSLFKSDITYIDYHIYLEIISGQAFPNSTRNSTKEAHAQEEKHDLKFGRYCSLRMIYVLLL